MYMPKKELEEGNFVKEGNLSVGSEDCKKKKRK